MKCEGFDDNAVDSAASFDSPPLRDQNRYVVFDSFAAEAVAVLNVAGHEARRLRRNLIDTEHVLLALIGKPTGIAAKAMAMCGVDLREARVEVERRVGAGTIESVAEPLYYATQMRNVLKRSWSIVGEYGDRSLYTEHLLLALLIERNCSSFEWIEC